MEAWTPETVERAVTALESIEVYARLCLPALWLLVGWYVWGEVISFRRARIGGYGR